MKNSAVKEMISNQFPDIEINNIRVEFIACIGGFEEYLVDILDVDDEPRRFVLKIEFAEMVGVL